MSTEQDEKAAETPRKRTQKYLRFKLTPEDFQLLDHLSEEQRQALLCDGSYKERAEKLQIPEGTVRSRLHRARAALDNLRQNAVVQ